MASPKKKSAKPTKKPPVRKRTKEQIESARAETARMYLAGAYQSEIAQKLGVTQQQISYDLKKIREAWRESAVRDFDEAREQELAKIDHLERTYWEAWQRSVGEVKTTTSKAARRTGGLHPGESVEKMERAIQQAGDSSYLRGVQWCIERRCALLGLDEPVKLDVNDRRRQAIETEREALKSMTPEELGSLYRNLGGSA